MVRPTPIPRPTSSTSSDDAPGKVPCSLLSATGDRWSSCATATWHPSSVVSDARSGIPSQLLCTGGAHSTPWASTTAAMPIPVAASAPAGQRGLTPSSGPAASLISWRIRLASIRAMLWPSRPELIETRPSTRPDSVVTASLVVSLPTSAAASSAISSRKRYTAGGCPGCAVTLRRWLPLRQAQFDQIGD